MEKKKEQKQYVSPKLIRYGKLTKLTTALNGSLDDGGGGMTIATLPPGGSPLP